jgi:hypothetical protein
MLPSLKNLELWNTCTQVAVVRGIERGKEENLNLKFKFKQRSLRAIILLLSNARLPPQS